MEARLEWGGVWLAGASAYYGLALPDPRSYLEMCALIPALYRNHWEAMNPAWSLRERPEIMAGLYQPGFARSKPYAAPRANAFGDRVRRIHDELRLNELRPQPQ